MDIMTIMEFAGADSALGHHHVLHGTDTFRTLEPGVLAARIRGLRDSEADEDTGKACDRAAAMLYATYCADSMDAAHVLLRRYLDLLDAGQRPLWRPPVPA